MQVSWIDSEHLKGLLKQLQDAAPETTPEPQAWETHTLPDAPPVPSLSLEPAPAPPVAEATPAEEPEEAPATPRAEIQNAPEVERIRNRLREVRERAAAAGLLKRAEPPAPPAPPIPPAMAEPAASLAEEAEKPEQPPAAEEAAQASEAPAPITAPSEEETPVPAPVEAPPEEADDSLYFEVPLGSVLERLDAFAEWARRRVAPAELLLLDEHGDLLLGAEARAALVLSVMLAASAARRSTAAGVCETSAVIARQPTPAGGELTVLSCPTRLGLIHLAVERSISLPDSEIDLLRQALLSAVEVSASDDSPL